MEIKMDKILSEKTRASIYRFIEKGHSLQQILSAYENANKDVINFEETWSILKEFIEFSYKWYEENRTWDESFVTFKNLYESKKNDVFSDLPDEKPLNETELKKKHEDKIRNISYLIMKKNESLQSEYEKMISEINLRKEKINQIQKEEIEQIDEAIIEEKIADEEEMVNGFVSELDSDEIENEGTQIIEPSQLIQQQEEIEQIDETIIEEKNANEEEMVNGFVSESDSNEIKEEIQENEVEEEVQAFNDDLTREELMTVTNFFEDDGKEISEETLDFDSKKELFPGASFKEEGLDVILADNSTIICQSTIERTDEETLIDEISVEIAQEEMWNDLEESINDNNTHVIDEDVIAGLTDEALDLEEITKTFNLNSDDEEISEEGSTMDAFAFLKGLEDKYDPTEALDLDFFDFSGNEVEISSLSEIDIEQITLGEEVEFENKKYTIIGIIEKENEPVKIKIEDQENREIKIVNANEIDF